jgi:peroxiredoxin
LSRSGMNPVASCLLALAIIAGLTLIPPVTCRAQDGTAMADFHFFEEPPEANDMTMATADGRTIKISDFKGKVVLLNFWRQNCRYCQQEKEYLKGMIGKLSNDDIKVLCVDFWDPASWVKSYAKKNGGELIFAFKPENVEPVVENIVKGRIMGYFILSESKEAIYEVKGFPSTYVIGREGKVVAAHLGMAKWADPMVVHWLSRLLGMGGAPYSPADAYYELPEWFERILAGPAESTAGSQPAQRQ